MLYFLSKFLLLCLFLICAFGQDTTQYTVLEEFYTSLGGQGWKNSTNWLEGDPCATEWYGLTCSNQSQVIAM